MSASTPTTVGLRRVKVLLLIKTLDPGGAEKLVITQLAARTDARMPYQVAFVKSRMNRWEPRVRDQGVPVTDLRGDSALNLGWALRLRRLILSDAIDVVHSQSPSVACIARLIIRSIPRRKRPIHAYTEHNLWASYHPLTRLLNRLTYPLDLANFAVSNEVKASIGWPASRTVETLTLGVIPSELERDDAKRDLARRSLSIAPDEILVGTVANLRSAKALHDLLTAAEIVLKAEPTSRFVIVGGGRLENELRVQCANLKISDRVNLLGSRDDAIDVLRAFDVFALSSVHEGMPVAIMEALALGVPVVSTAVGGVPEMIRNGVEGRLVRPCWPDGLAEALIEVVRSADLRSRMGQAGLKRAEQFDARKNLVKVEMRYREVLSARRGDSTSVAHPAAQDG